MLRLWSQASWQTKESIEVSDLELENDRAPLTPAQRRWLVLVMLGREKGLTSAEINAPSRVMSSLVSMGLAHVVSDGGWNVTGAGKDLCRSIR